jgi:hypothetical protein
VLSLKSQAAGGSLAQIEAGLTGCQAHLEPAVVNISGVTSPVLKAHAVRTTSPTTVPIGPFISLSPWRFDNKGFAAGTQVS